MLNSHLRCNLCKCNSYTPYDFQGLESIYSWIFWNFQFLLSCAGFVFTKLNCHLSYPVFIKSQKTLLSLTSLNSSGQIVTLSLISCTKSWSSNKLVLNFQYEGPYLCFFILLNYRTIAEWSELKDGIMSTISTSSWFESLSNKKSNLCWMRGLCCHWVKRLTPRFLPARYPPGQNSNKYLEYTSKNLF